MDLRGNWASACPALLQCPRRSQVAPGSCEVSLSHMGMADRKASVTGTMRLPAPQTGMNPVKKVPEDHLERLLDQALEETFPASDPVAVSSAAEALTEAAGAG